MQTIHPVILCGGSGTRLWPRSRATKPKPFLPLVGEQTLFEQALSRAAPEAEGDTLFGAPVVVTGSAHLCHVEEQMALTAGGTVIVEPAAKNTAAAIALAALVLPEDALMLVCPSDHHIGDVAAFRAATSAAARLASEGWLVAFGIEPTYPETGYGYIRSGEAIDLHGYRIAQFVEKPDHDRAARFLAEGGYSWNGGIFAFRAGDFLKELTQHRPAIALAVRASIAKATRDGHRVHPDAAEFAAIAGESVDYAVMENAGRAAMVPARMAWSDIGNWRALLEARPRDAQGNSTIGPAELVDCTNVLVESDGPRVSVIGLDGVIVVVDGNEVMVTSASGVQKVGTLTGAANQ